jgi:hypothetical protein
LHGRSNNKFASWGCEFASGATLLLINLFQNLFCGSDVFSSGIGQF